MAIQSIGTGRIEFNQPGTRYDQTVHEVQRALNQIAGAKVVPENGAFDRYTFDALRKFQQAFASSGLQPTGNIDQRTIDVINRELSRRFGQPQLNRSGPVHPNDVQAKTVEGSMQAAAARAQLWARESLHQAQHMAGNPGHSGPIGPAARVQLERNSQTAGIRAGLIMNTNEAWAALKAGGRDPVRDVDGVLGNPQARKAAERQLNQVAMALTRDQGPEAYLSMPPEDRAKMWAAAMLSDPAAGQRIMSQLTTDQSLQQGIEDLQKARDVLLSANPDPQVAARINELYEQTRLTPQ